MIALLGAAKVETKYCVLSKVIFFYVLCEACNVTTKLLEGFGSRNSERNLIEQGCMSKQLATTPFIAGSGHVKTAKCSPKDWKPT